MRVAPPEPAGKRRPLSTAEMEKRIQSLRNEGKGILKIGRELGVGTSVVQRVLVDQGG